jgi:hypothetical protein
LGVKYHVRYGDLILSLKGKGKVTPKEAYVALWVPGGSGSRMSRQSVHEDGKVVSPTHWPPLPPGISLYSFLEAQSIPGTWTCQMPRQKIPSDTTGDRSGDLRASSLY